MSRLRELLDAGQQVFTAEFPVIDGANMAKVERAAARLRPWFDAVNATDNPAANAHASNVASAIAMKMHGLEPILQIACRDKNRLAIEADLSGAALHGIVNVEMLTGDDVTAGDEPETRRVFDVDGPIAVRIAKTLRSGTYLSGRPLNPAPDFFIGAVENPGAHVQRLCRDLECAGDLLENVRRRSTDAALYLGKVGVRHAGRPGEVADALLCGLALLADELADVVERLTGLQCHDRQLSFTTAPAPPSRTRCTSSAVSASMRSKSWWRCCEHDFSNNASASPSSSRDASSRVSICSN